MWEREAIRNISSEEWGSFDEKVDTMWNRWLTSGFNEVNNNQCLANGDSYDDSGLLYCFDDISLNYTTGGGSRGHHLVGVGIFRVFAFKKAFIFMLTPAWALALAFAAERMRKAILNLFCRRHNRLYGWLPVDDWYDVGGLWILSLRLNSYLLELGSHDGEEPPGGCCGVHILQMLFWGQVLCVLVCCLAAYLRQRSELSPRFPSRVRKVGAVRWARGRIAKTWICRRAVIACFLMMNLAHADVFRLGHEIARHDLSNAFEHEHVGQHNPDRSVLSSSCARHMPTGNSRCHDDVREDPTGIKLIR